MSWDFLRDLYGEPEEERDDQRRRPAPGKVSLTSQIKPVQRHAASSARPRVSDGLEFLAQPVQRKAATAVDVDDPFALHLTSRPADESPDAVHAAAARGVATSAQELPHLEQIQKSFGRHDVTQVQAHVGGAAAEASEAIGAEAYATGQHVAFQSSPSLHTAAHEAAHVVQQKGGVQLKGGVGADGDVYERHADAVADKVVAGESAEALLDQMTGATAAASATATVQMKKGGEPKLAAAPTVVAFASPMTELATHARAVVEAAEFALLPLHSATNPPDSELTTLNDRLASLAAFLHQQAEQRTPGDEAAIEAAIKAADGIAKQLRGQARFRKFEGQLRKAIDDVRLVLRENNAREARLESSGALASMVEQSLAVLNEWKAFGENQDNLGQLPGLSARSLESVIATTEGWSLRLASDPGAAASLSRAVVDQHELATTVSAELHQVLKQPISNTTKDTIHAYFDVLALSTERRARSDKALDLARAKRRRLPLDRAESALAEGEGWMLHIEQRDPEAGGKARAAHKSLAARHGRMEAQIASGKSPGRGELDDLVLETREYEFLHRVDILQLQARQSLEAINQVKSPRSAEKVRYQRKLDDLVSTLAGVRRRYKETAEADFYASPAEARSKKTEALRVMEAQLAHHLAEESYEATLDEAKKVLDDQLVDQFLSQLIWTVALTVSGNFVAAAARGATAAMTARMGMSLTGGARVANIVATMAEGTYGAVTQKYIQGDPGSLTTLLAVNVLTPFAIDRVMGLAKTAERVGEDAVAAAAKSERMLDDASKIAKVDDAALDADELVSTAARLDHAAKKSVWVKHGRTGALGLRAGANLTAEMIMGAAVDYATRRAMAEGGRPPSDQTAAEWLMQGASIAIGRHLSVNVRAIRDRIRAVEAGARGTSARLLKVADTVATDAAMLEAGGPPDAAPDVINTYGKLLADEQAYFEKELTNTVDGRGRYGRKQLLGLLAKNRRASGEFEKLASGELAEDGGDGAGAKRGQPENDADADGKEAARPGEVDPNRDPFSKKGKAENAAAIRAGEPGYNAVVGHVKSQTDGLAIMQRLMRGDATALAEIGFESGGTFDPSTREWALGKFGNKYVIIAGELSGVDWRPLAGVEPIGHSHPIDRSRRTLQGRRQLDINNVVAEAGDDARLVFSSPEDVKFAAQRGLGEHFIAIPYEHVGGSDITLATKQASGRVPAVLVLKDAAVLAPSADGTMRYTARASIKAGSTPIWQGTIDAVFPPGGEPRLEFNVSPQPGARAGDETSPAKTKSGGRWRGPMGPGPEPAAVRARETPQEVGASVPRQPRSAEQILESGPGRTADDMPKGWTDRSDAARLQEHGLAIDKHELATRVELRGAVARGAKEEVIGAHKAKLTEADGERAATKYMLAEEPSAELVRGFMVGDGFDQIWVRRGSRGEIIEYIIVEAKGPGAQLGETVNKGTQMSNEWVTKTARQLAQRGATPAERRLARDLVDALDSGHPPVTGRVIESDGAGGYIERGLPEDQRATFDTWDPSAQP